MKSALKTVYPSDEFNERCASVAADGIILSGVQRDRS